MLSRVNQFLYLLYRDVVPKNLSFNQPPTSIVSKMLTQLRLETIGIFEISQLSPPDEAYHHLPYTNHHPIIIKKVKFSLKSPRPKQSVIYPDARLRMVESRRSRSLKSRERRRSLCRDGKKQNDSHIPVAWRITQQSELLTPELDFFFLLLLPRLLFFRRAQTLFPHAVRYAVLYY